MFKREYSKEFEHDFNELSESAFERVDKSIRTLAQFPDLAKDYLPYNEAGRMMIPIRSYPVPQTYRILFLEVQRTKQVIRFMRILDGRSDPLQIIEMLSNIDS